MKTVFLFSGQGSQYPGMGAELAEKSSAAKQILECGSDIMGFDLAKKLSDSTPEELAQTRLSQPAIFTTSLLALAAARENGIDNCAAAGHSLGEYAAMYASGMLGMEDAFKAIKLRAAAMAEAAEATGGSMAAIIGSDNETIAKVCEEVNGFCAPANYNSPQQTVVAGAPEALQELDVLVKEAGGRAMKVAVSGAFHSPYMAEATEGLATYIQDGHAPSPLLIPVMANMTAAPYPADPQTASEVLANQVSHAVRWVDTLHALQDQGIDTFIEVGPGKTLSGLVKRTLSDVRVYSCETAEQVAAIADELA